MSTGKRKQNYHVEDDDWHDKEETWHPDLKGTVTHSFTIGRPPAPMPVQSGLAFDPESPSSEPIHDMPVSGSLTLCDVPGSHLDYAIELKVGELLENDLVEQAAYFRRFVIVMDIYETFVPESHRGKKLGEKLVRAAFALAANRGWAVRPSCSYISDTYLAKSGVVHSPVSIYKQGPTAPSSEVSVQSLLLLSWASSGPHSLRERRRILSKKSVKQLVEVAKKLSPQKHECVGAAVVNGSCDKAVMVERLLRADFEQDAIGFYRWMDPASRLQIVRERKKPTQN
jgi:predicted GNAT family acetyltransferase